MRFLIVVIVFNSACAAAPEFTVSKAPGLTFIYVNDTADILATRLDMEEIIRPENIRG